MPYEIERKYLIAMPDTAKLKAIDGTIVSEIRQTYLKSDSGRERRIRQRKRNGTTTYFLTEKTVLSDLVRIENECEITEATAKKLLDDADDSRKSIIKTRYKVPFAGFNYEIDIYPFWDDRATMEIELDSAEDVPPVPEFAEIIKDITFDKSYKNGNLAKEVPFENIKITMGSAK